MNLHQMKELKALENSGQLNRASEYRDFLRMQNWESQKEIFRNMKMLDSLKEDILNQQD